MGQQHAIPARGNQVLEVHFDLEDLRPELQGGEVVAPFAPCLRLVGDALGLDGLVEGGGDPGVAVDVDEGLLHRPAGILVIQIAVDVETEGIPALAGGVKGKVAVHEDDCLVLIAGRRVEPAHAQRMRDLRPGFGELEVAAVAWADQLDRIEPVVPDDGELAVDQRPGSPASGGHGPQPVEHGLVFGVVPVVREDLGGIGGITIAVAVVRPVLQICPVDLVVRDPRLRRHLLAAQNVGVDPGRVAGRLPGERTVVPCRQHRLGTDGQRWQRAAELVGGCDAEAQQDDVLGAEVGVDVPGRGGFLGAEAGPRNVGYDGTEVLIHIGGHPANPDGVLLVRCSLSQCGRPRVGIGIPVTDPELVCPALWGLYRPVIFFPEHPYVGLATDITVQQGDRLVLRVRSALPLVMDGDAHCATDSNRGWTPVYYAIQCRYQEVKRNDLRVFSGGIFPGNDMLGIRGVMPCTTPGLASTKSLESQTKHITQLFLLNIAGVYGFLGAHDCLGGAEFPPLAPHIADRGIADHDVGQRLRLEAVTVDVLNGTGNAGRTNNVRADLERAMAQAEQRVQALVVARDDAGVVVASQRRGDMQGAVQLGYDPERTGLIAAAGERAEAVADVAGTLQSGHLWADQHADGRRGDAEHAKGQGAPGHPQADPADGGSCPQGCDHSPQYTIGGRHCRCHCRSYRDVDAEELRHHDQHHQLSVLRESAGPCRFRYDDAVYRGMHAPGLRTDDLGQ